TRFSRDWSSDVCSSDLRRVVHVGIAEEQVRISDVYLGTFAHGVLRTHRNPIAVLVGQRGRPVIRVTYRGLIPCHAALQRPAFIDAVVSAERNAPGVAELQIQAVARHGGIPTILNVQRLDAAPSGP